MLTPLPNYRINGSEEAKSVYFSWDGHYFYKISHNPPGHSAGCRCDSGIIPTEISEEVKLLCEAWQNSAGFANLTIQEFLEKALDVG